MVVKHFRFTGQQFFQTPEILFKVYFSISTPQSLLRINYALIWNGFTQSQEKSSGLHTGIKKKSHKLIHLRLKTQKKEFSVVFSHNIVISGNWQANQILYSKTTWKTQINY